jgi:hypothetical protein
MTTVEIDERILNEAYRMITRRLPIAWDDTPADRVKRCLEHIIFLELRSYSNPENRRAIEREIHAYYARQAERERQRRALLLDTEPNPFDITGLHYAHNRPHHPPEDPNVRLLNREFRITTAELQQIRELNEPGEVTIQSGERVTRNNAGLVSIHTLDTRYTFNFWMREVPPPEEFPDRKPKILRNAVVMRNGDLYCFYY